MIVVMRWGVRGRRRGIWGREWGKWEVIEKINFVEGVIEVDW